MKFMILVKSNPDLEARLEAMGDSQMKASMAAMEVFNEELKKGRRVERLRRPAPEPRGKASTFRGERAHRQ